MNTFFKRISLSRASLSELRRLPGIGKKLSDKIVEFRTANKLNTVYDIMQISYIKKKRFSKIETFISI